jgi:predicted nucleic acid-binding protein
MISYVLDTSALIALHKNEDGAQEVAAILQSVASKKSTALASFITLTEMFYRAWQVEGKDLAYKNHLKLKMLPIEFVYPNEKTLLTAGEIKATHSLSLADALIAALAKETQSTLVHKDPEFKSLSGLIQQKPLPYKTSRA